MRWCAGRGRPGLRVFVIGIGASPNQPFLRRLAEETGGSCDFVSPGEDMIRAVQRVMARLRQPRREALPAMWPAQPDWTLQLPAVAHAGQAVHVIAGFEAAPIGEAVIAGATVALPGHATGDATLSRVVAYQRLLSGQFADAAEAAERYQLVTEWTSLVAVLERAEGEKAAGLPQLAPVEQMVPAGWGGIGRSQLWKLRHARRFARQPGVRLLFPLELRSAQAQLCPRITRGQRRADVRQRGQRAGAAAVSRSGACA